MKLLTSRFLFVVYTFLSLMLFTSAGIPWVSSFPRDIGKLKGNIKFLFIYSYDIKKDSLGGFHEHFSDKSVVTFHNSGSSIVTDRVRSDCSIEQSFCQYDSKGNLIEWSNTQVVSDHIDMGLYNLIHRYDDKNREVEAIEVRQKNEWVKSGKGHWRSFADTTRITYSFLLGSDKALKHTFNKSGSEIKVDTINYFREYNDFSNLYYPSLDKHSDKEVREEKDFANIYNYDKSDNIIEQQYYKPKDSLQSKVLYQYDSHNNIESIKIYRKGSLVNKTIHSYIYDAIGNWTTDSTFVNENLNNIMIRRFEYN